MSIQSTSGAIDFVHFRAFLLEVAFLPLSRFVCENKDEPVQTVSIYLALFANLVNSVINFLLYINSLVPIPPGRNNIEFLKLASESFLVFIQTF